MAVRIDNSTEAYSATNGAAGTSFSFVCWAYMSVNRADWQFIAGFEGSASNASVYLELGCSPGGGLQLYSSSGGVDSTVGLTTGTWYRVGISVSTTTATIYVGTDSGGLTSATGTVANGTRSFFFLGTDSYGEWWNGRIAAAKLWNAALDSTEITAEFQSYTAVRTANLVRVHKLQVPETTDYSGNSNSLTGGTGASTEADPPIPVGTNAAAVEASFGVAAQAPTLTASGNAAAVTATFTTDAQNPTVTTGAGSGTAVDAAVATFGVDAQAAVALTSGDILGKTKIFNSVALRSAQKMRAPQPSAFIMFTPVEGSSEPPVVEERGQVLYCYNDSAIAAVIQRRYRQQVNRDRVVVHGGAAPATTPVGANFFFGAA